MKNLKFITFTDIHVCDTNPSARLGNYRQDIVEKLKQIGAVGNKLGVDFYILGGDLFHLKLPIRNSHSLIRELTEIFKNYNAPIFSTEGNHDLRQDSYETFNEQPLSVLYATKVLKQVRNKKITVNDIPVEITAIPFEEEPNLSAVKKPDPERPKLNICILHLYSTPKGGNLFSTKLFSYQEIAQTNHDIYVMGHYHIDQGIQELNNGENTQHFINVGAIGRGTLSEDDINRTPKIGLVSVTLEDKGTLTIDAKAVKLKVKPAEIVFDLKEKKAEKKKIEEAEKFVNKLETEVSEIGKNIENIEEEIESTNLEKEVVNRVKHYLSEADLKIKEIK